MDRLSSLLELFSPKAEQIELMTSQNSVLLLPGESTIALVHKGSAQINNASSADEIIQPGDLIWVTQESHRRLHGVDGEFQLLCCHLKFGSIKLNPLFDMLPPVIRISSDDPARQALNPIIELLLRESTQQRCGQDTVLNRLAEVLLIHVLRFLMENQKLGKGVLAGLSDIRLARAITAMHRLPEHRWNVKSLASEAGMSRTAFNQHFRDTVGCPPGEYLSQWRMRLACRLLETGQMVIAQIVDQLGYKSETAFFRAFRRQIGMSPGKYRLRANATG